MAGSVNKVILVGNLGADPEVKRMQNGNSVANFSLATSETWRDKNTGERRERTEWHRIAVWNEGLVKICEQYLKKGMKIYIEGQLQTRKWTDQQGIDRYSTEVVLTNFNSTMTMLDSARDGGRDDDNRGGQRGGGQSGGNQRGGQQSSGRGNNYGGGGFGGGYSDDLSDEIPFAPCM